MAGKPVLSTFIPHSRLPDIYRSGAGDDVSFGKMTVSYDQLPPLLVNKPTMSFDIQSDFVFKSRLEHFPSTFLYQLIQNTSNAGNIFCWTGETDNVILRHERILSPSSEGFLVFATQGYALFFDQLKHNFWLYLLNSFQRSLIVPGHV